MANRHNRLTGTRPDLSGAPELLHLGSVIQKVESQGCTISAYRNALSDARKALHELFVDGAPAAELIAWQSAVTDTLIIHLWDQIIPTCAASNLALVAVGGYGRAELHPNSDIDILILTEIEYQASDEEISRFVTSLWDLGLDVGHSVRDINHCVDEAQSDVTVITNLLESRLLCGAEKLFKDLHLSLIHI